MGVDERSIDEIVRRILTVVQPDRVVVFGSAATGEMNADSDIDLLVLEESPKDPRRESVTVRSALRGLGVAFDVIEVCEGVARAPSVFPFAVELPGR